MVVRQNITVRYVYVSGGGSRSALLTVTVYYLNNILNIKFKKNAQYKVKLNVKSRSVGRLVCGKQ